MPQILLLGQYFSKKNSDGKEQPIYYYSAKLSASEKNYSVTERECLAVIKAIQKFRPYIEGYNFEIYTDYSSLKWLMTTKDLTGRLVRWSLKLQPYTFTIHHRKGSLNLVPDCLSRQFDVSSIILDSLEITGSPLNIDFSNPSFKSPEYEDLKSYIIDKSENLPDLLISDGIIYKRTQHPSGDVLLDVKIWKIWVPSELHHDLIVSAHDSQNKSLGGIAKTLFRLRERFYWPHMAIDVNNYIKNCEKCNTSKSPNIVLTPPLHGCFNVDRPFQHIFIDFLALTPEPKREIPKCLSCWIS